MKAGELERFLDHVGAPDFASWLGRFGAEPESAFAVAVDEATDTPNRPSSRFLLEHREALRRFVHDLAEQRRNAEETLTPGIRARRGSGDDEDTPPTTQAVETPEITWSEPLPDPTAESDFDEVVTVVRPVAPTASAPSPPAPSPVAPQPPDPTAADTAPVPAPREAARSRRAPRSPEAVEDPDTAPSLVPDDDIGRDRVVRSGPSWREEIDVVPTPPPPQTPTPTPAPLPLPVRRAPPAPPEWRISVVAATFVALGTFLLGIGVGAVLVAWSLSVGG